jgi:outer membrane lipopolysaccharide assembly protein LptE/RlpB
MTNLRLNSLLKALLSILIILFVSSCGFTPRGSITGTTDIGAVFIDASNSVPIAWRLRAALNDRNFNVTNNKENAKILIRLRNELQSRRVVSVENTGRVSEYEIRHSVDMQIAQSIDDAPPKYDAQQRANKVSVIREYTYDRTGVLGKADEADILRSEMREELVNHLLLRLLANVRQRKN